MDDDPITIWHNPRCSKSRAALQLLQERGASPRVVHYLDAPPSAADLDRALRLLDRQPRELMRRDELYARLGLDDPALTREQLIDAMAAHPALIERPVVLRGDRAVLGRPPEVVLDLLDEA